MISVPDFCLTRIIPPRSHEFTIPLSDDLETMANLAKVKSVASGDSLLLRSPASGAEKILSLAYVSAPRLKRDGDEVTPPRNICFCAFSIIVVPQLIVPPSPTLSNLATFSANLSSAKR